MSKTHPPQIRLQLGSALEVLLAFLRLGCTSFGGPIAHLGYFRAEFVERRQWCSEATLAELIALAQSLPGPASSQVGFALGLLRAGWMGGLAAWVGFTLPSALLMLAFAFGGAMLPASAGDRLLHGLEIVAVAVVAQAVVSMQRSLAPDRMRMMFALFAAGIVLLGPARYATGAAILLGAVCGLAAFRGEMPHSADSLALPISKKSGALAGAVFFGLLILLPILAHLSTGLELRVFSAFYWTGAAVFGGGHVVLPMLQSTVVAPGWVTEPSFLAGYGAAQALPGPLFAVGAYLGAQVRPSSSPLFYGLAGLVGLFAPGLLAMAAVLPFWSQLRSNRSMQAALRGVNASVVGVLIAALYKPLWTTTIAKPSDFLLALTAFALLTLWKAKPWLVTLAIAAIAMLPDAFGK